MSTDEKDWARLSSRRKDEITESLLSALAMLEVVQRRMPPGAPPPIYLPADLNTGAMFAIDTGLAPRPVNGSVLILDGWGGKDSGAAQVQCYTSRRVGTCVEGRMVSLYPKRGGRVLRLDLNFRWHSANEFSTRGPQAPWVRDADTAAHIRFSLEIIHCVQEYGKSHPALFLGLDGLAIQLPCTNRFARLLLSGRDKGANRGRRAALRHFVDHYFRGQETKSGDDEVWVRKHLRGAVECEWGGFVALLCPPAAWQKEHNDWVEARDAYRNLPPKDRAAARDLIRTTYGLPPRELNAAMRGD